MATSKRRLVNAQAAVIANLRPHTRPNREVQTKARHPPLWTLCKHLPSASFLCRIIPLWLSLSLHQLKVELVCFILALR